MTYPFHSLILTCGHNGRRRNNKDCRSWTKFGRYVSPPAHVYAATLTGILVKLIKVVV
jgi:hypothetical protein